jgi:elongation factor 1-gamma
VWLFRGKGIPLQMKEHPQFEYYKLRELDLEVEADKNLLTDFWCCKEGDIVNGLPVKIAKLHK